MWILVTCLENGELQENCFFFIYFKFYILNFIKYNIIQINLDYMYFRLQKWGIYKVLRIWKFLYESEVRNMKIFCDIGNVKINLKSVKLFSHCVQDFNYQSVIWKLEETWWEKIEEI